MDHHRSGHGTLRDIPNGQFKPLYVLDGQARFDASTRPNAFRQVSIKFRITARQAGRDTSPPANGADRPTQDKPRMTSHNGADRTVVCLVATTADTVPCRCDFSHTSQFCAFRHIITHRLRGTTHSNGIEYVADTAICGYHAYCPTA